MGGDAIKAALLDADVDPSSVNALFVGNMMSGQLSFQQHLGPLLANAAGLDNAEAATAEVELAQTGWLPV
jgi:acetyl-CoA C-acetyltransferase